ncbi:MAG: DUF202 domain-containing protein [Candidatus Eremiobacteraeota bacterium]|nr:DUF202 domain-containing protein [Candidatus Eremiobacteraeota bacterium]
MEEREHPATGIGGRIKKDLVVREQLAYERTVLANERTLLAYLRTALAFFAAGVTFLHFFPGAVMGMIGWGFVGAGLGLFITAPLRYRAVGKIMKSHCAGMARPEPGEER